MIGRLLIIACVIALSVRHVLVRIRNTLAYARRTPYRELSDIHMVDRSFIDRRASIALGYNVGKRGAWIVKTNIPIINFLIPENVTRSDIIEAIRDEMAKLDVFHKTWSYNGLYVQYCGAMLLGGYTELKDDAFKIYVGRLNIDLYQLMLDCKAYYDGYYRIYEVICQRLRDMGVYALK